jgi:hypothetical protein
VLVADALIVDFVLLDELLVGRIVGQRTAGWD